MLEAMDAWLDAVDLLPSSQVVLGEPGIGKTSVTGIVREQAVHRGYRVLAAAPTEPEAELAFASLGDLLEGAVAEVLPLLPEPQRLALERCLLLRRDDGLTSDLRAVGMATLNSLRLLSAERPLLLAIDNAEWVDGVSSDVVRFALRRLRTEQVAVLLARRTASAGDQGLSSVEGMACTVTELPPLSHGAIHAILVDRLDLVLTRPLLRRVHELSRGNPFYALELGRAIRDGRLSLLPGEALPEDLHALVGARIRGLPRDTQECLAACAALLRPTVRQVARAMPGTDPAVVLEPAVTAGVVRIVDGTVGFDHPLLASVAYAALDREHRRTLHARLAEVVPDAVERARHLALAVSGPDATVAADVELAAAATFARGASADAAEMIGLARRLTPEDLRDERRRRALLEAQYRFESGSTAAAAELLQELLHSSPSGVERAEVLTRLAWVRHFEDDVGGGVDLLKQARSETRPQDPIRGEIEQGLAWGLLLMRREPEAAWRYACAAAAHAERRGDPAALAEALATVALTGFVQGKEPSGALERGMALEPSTLHLRVLRHPSFARAYILACSDELDRAEATLLDLRRRADDHGDESARATIEWHLATIALERADFRTAASLADAAHDLAVQNSQLPTQVSALGMKALVLARGGDAVGARAAASHSMSLADSTAFDPSEPMTALARGGEYPMWAMGELELSLGRPGEAARYLGPLAAALLDAGVREPGELRFLPAAIEALTMLGRIEWADRLAAVLEAQAERVRRPSVRASALAARALVRSGRRDLAGAVASLEQAAVHAAEAPLPFEHARVLLNLGRMQRRTEHKRAAREALRRAADLFDAMGARVWSANAMAELGRIGGRPPAGVGLTPTEQRVAELVARGMSNKEVAAELLVSPKAVEGSLSRIYAKRGLRSRAELASVLASEGKR